jgi:nitroimidazol reductase NimA-like FMN-containing flavoprotein (pyridoxamine 5'-phosphate oxidase superfamily)
MAYNGIVGKNKKPGTTKANWRSYTKQAEYNATPKQRKKRAELNKIARERKIYGKRYTKWVDLSHTKSGKVVLEKRKTNRARNWANWKSTLK